MPAAARAPALPTINVLPLTDARAAAIGIVRVQRDRPAANDLNGRKPCPAIAPPESVYDTELLLKVTLAGFTPPASTVTFGRRPAVVVKHHHIPGCDTGPTPE